LHFRCTALTFELSVWNEEQTHVSLLNALRSAT